MKARQYVLLFSAVLMLAFTACNPKEKPAGDDKDTTELSEMEKKVKEFALVELNADLSHLSENQKKMLSKLFEAAKIMDELFWKQAYGDKQELFAQIEDPAARTFAEINYGPWERLNDNKPFVEGVGEKPLGSNFYPHDLDTGKFAAWENPDKLSLYTLVRRDEQGELKTVWYHEAFKEQVEKAAELLNQAAELAEDAGFKKYLELRAKALLNDEYFESDMAWMSMKNNMIDFVVGPIETYEDRLYGSKAAYEAFILIKDMEWSQRLSRFAAILPELQKALPVEQPYKNETPGSDSDLNAYDVIYYAGDCNAGSKTIAINLPNDPKVRNAKGSRKLQLKNAMRAKFDTILVPIANLLITEEQRKHIKFDAFFENTMFHEVGHGLGLGNTVKGDQSVREALQKNYTPIEEGKADILGLWIVVKLNEMGEFKDKDLMDNFVTFMASIFRSIRFGAASAHGKANMIRFNYFQEKGAFTRDQASGTYRVDFEKMKQAMLDLAKMILVIQGDGDMQAAEKLIKEKGEIGQALQKDLDRISEAGIPRDIRYKQGMDVVGL